MSLSPKTDAALQRWLGMSTWYTSHGLDMGRWYEFVDCYAREHGFSINESEIREIINGKLEAMNDGIRENEELQQVLVARTHLACSILEFLRWRVERP